MILAQTLGEYRVVAALQQGIVAARIRVEDALQQAEPIHYGIAGLAVVLLWLFMGRRS